MPSSARTHPHLHSFPTRRSSDLVVFSAQHADIRRAKRLHEQHQHVRAVRRLDSHVEYFFSGEAFRALQQREAAGEPGEAFAAGLEDRKSTRLNSSHLVISYAVFCSHPPTPTLFPYTTLFRSRCVFRPARRHPPRETTP